MKKYKFQFSLYAILLISLPLQAQTQLLDSLQKELLRADKDSLKMHINFRLAKMLTYTMPQEALEHAQQALIFAKKTKNKEYEGGVKNQIGVILRNTSQYDSALAYHLEAMEVFEQIHHDRGLAITLVNIANIFSLQNNHKKSLEYYEKAINFFDKIKDWQALGVINTNIGNIYFQERNWQNAQNYYFQSLNYSRTAGDSAQVYMIYANLSQVFDNLKEYDKALRYAQQALKTTSKPILSQIHCNLGSIYLKHRKDYSKAFFHIEKALQNAQESQSLDNEIEARISLAEYYYLTKQFDLSKEHYEEVLNLKDSLHQREINVQTESLQKKLENLTAKTEKRLLQVRSESQEKIIRKQREFLFLIMFVLLLISVLVIIIVRKNRLYQKLYQEIIQKNQLLNEQKEEIEQLNQDLEKKVEVRTQELREQNAQLEKYAFYNSHRLRAPVAQILGLFHLYQIEKDPQIKEKILQMLKESTEYLDGIVREMQRIVEGRAKID